MRNELRVAWNTAIACLHVLQTADAPKVTRGHDTRPHASYAIAQDWNASRPPSRITIQRRDEKPSDIPEPGLGAEFKLSRTLVIRDNRALRSAAPAIGDLRLVELDRYRLRMKVGSIDCDATREPLTGPLQEFVAQYQQRGGKSQWFVETSGGHVEDLESEFVIELRDRLAWAKSLPKYTDTIRNVERGASIAFPDFMRLFCPCNLQGVLAQHQACEAASQNAEFPLLGELGTLPEGQVLGYVECDPNSGDSELKIVHLRGTISGGRASAPELTSSKMVMHMTQCERTVRRKWVLRLDGTLNCRTSEMLLESYDLGAEFTCLLEEREVGLGIEASRVSEWSGSVKATLRTTD